LQQQVADQRHELRARAAEHRRKAARARQLAVHASNHDLAGQLKAHGIVHEHVADQLEQQAKLAHPNDNLSGQAQETTIDGGPAQVVAD
jgi:hypothetical protein